MYSVHRLNTCDLPLLSELEYGDKDPKSAGRVPGEVINSEVEEVSTSSAGLAIVPDVQVHVPQCP